MTLEEIAYLIADRLPGTTLPAHTTIEELKESVTYWRARLLRQSFTSERTFPQAARQSLGSVPLQLVDPLTGQAPAGDIPPTHVVRRTVVPIPQPNRVRSSGDFIYVGGNGGHTPFLQVSPYEAQLRKANKFTSTTPAFSYHDGYLHIYNSGVTTVQVQAIFEDPRKVIPFNRYLPQAQWFTEESEYPIPSDLLQNLVGGILSGEYRLQQRQTDPAETALNPQP